jgi:hypothetical protein
MINENDQVFVMQILQEEPLNRTNITENLIPDNSFINPLIIERENRSDERRTSAE